MKTVELICRKLKHVDSRMTGLKSAKNVNKKETKRKFQNELLIYVTLLSSIINNNFIL